MSCVGLIEVFDKDENVLASAYYHWSGETMEILPHVVKAVTSTAADLYDEEAASLYSNHQKVVTAINMLAATGASLYGKTVDYIKSSGFDTDGITEAAFNEVDRNRGMIAIDEDSIEEFRNCDPFVKRVIVNIDNYTVDVNEFIGCTCARPDDCDIESLIPNVLGLDKYEPSMLEKLINEVLDKLEEDKISEYDFYEIDFEDVSKFYSELSDVGDYFLMEDCLYEDGDDIFVFNKL
jgi:hypothetical protein